MFSDILITLKIDAKQKFEKDLSSDSYKSDSAYLDCVEEIVNLLKQLHLTDLKSRSYTPAYEGWDFNHEAKLFKVYFFLSYEKSGIIQSHACMKKLLYLIHTLRNNQYGCELIMEM